MVRVLVVAWYVLVIAAGVWLVGNRAANAQPPSGSSAPDTLFAWALGQLIYDVADDAQGVSSALRGHSLSRTMYGFNDQVLNTQPFNGTGRLHFTHGLDSGAISGADDDRLINYQAFDGELLRDPERYGSRANARQARPFFTAGFNAPYTYPDLNSMFLAAAHSDGTVITPSFHRDWLFGALEAANPNWTSVNGKYLTLRPRPAEMGPGFPLPDSRHGDVKNRVDAPGGNDSIWIDLGYPVQRAPDGRKFKPLFAFYVEELDNVSRSSPGQDWSLPSITPWLWDRTLESFYAVPANDADSPPVGPAVPFPDLTRRGDPFGNPGEPVPPFTDFRTPGREPDDPEADWRGFRELELVAQGVARPAENPDHLTTLSRLRAMIWRKVALKQSFPEYPRQGPFVTSAQLESAMTAQRARQQLTEEIYRQLLLVTGVGPVPRSAIQDPSDADLAPRRWLAQLAVNIVDYIDEDEISTPFNFYSPLLDGLPLGDVGRSTPTPGGETIPRYWVFGTELPSVVLNEVMTELTESIPGAVSVKVWAELYHPVFDVPSPDPDRHPRTSPVPLFIRTGGASEGYSPYRIVIANTGPSGRTPLFDHPDNVLGSPDRVLDVAEFGPTLGTVGNPDARVPASIDHDGYLIVGPSSGGGRDAQKTIRATSTRPSSTRWHRSAGMEFGVSQAGPAPITVLLRRLANPHLPPDPRPALGDATNPFYNPYITIDYLDRIPREAGAAGTQSIGKLQPFASHPNRVQGQTVEQGAATRHTLGEANQPRQPFDWLVHLDRSLISPVELLSVTGVRPHDLTHRFITTPAGERADFAHRVPWFDEDLPPTGPPVSHRLYRLFEFLDTGDRSQGSAVHGRGPGRININSIHDLDTFRALLGRQLEDRFGLDRIIEIWERLLRLRSPGMLGPDPRVTETDRPFQSPAVGILPASDPQAHGRGVGIEDTIFRAWDPGAPGDRRRLFDVAGQDHPYSRSELLTAIDERVAVRSNVFAVWVTVGFFEVVDDTSSPIKLGAEIGQAANRQVRHRFFAIVDRTKLQLFGAQALGGSVEATRYLTRSQRQEGAVPGAGRHWVRLEALSGLTATEERDAAGAPTGRRLPWRILPGSYLFADTGAHREIVLVMDVDPTRNAIEATFSRPHAAGFEVSMPGNPGPQPDFDPRAGLFRDVIRQTIRLE